VNDQEIQDWLNNLNGIKSRVLSTVSVIDNLIGAQMAERFSFNIDDEAKFHRIFFETLKISFHAKIEMYKQFLKEYEKEWLDKVPDFFQILEDLKKIRNNFAHSMNPSRMELENREHLPDVLMYNYKSSEMVILEYSKDEIREIEKKMERIRELMLTVMAKIMNHKNKTREEITKRVKSLTELSSK